MYSRVYKKQIRAGREKDAPARGCARVRTTRDIDNRPAGQWLRAKTASTPPPAPHITPMHPVCIPISRINSISPCVSITWKDNSDNREMTSSATCVYFHRLTRSQSHVYAHVRLSMQVVDYRNLIRLDSVFVADSLALRCWLQTLCLHLCRFYAHSSTVNSLFCWFYHSERAFLR